jgi:hypothetical protein
VTSLIRSKSVFNFNEGVACLYGLLVFLVLKSQICVFLVLKSQICATSCRCSFFFSAWRTPVIHSSQVVVKVSLGNRQRPNLISFLASVSAVAGSEAIVFALLPCLRARSALRTGDSSLGKSTALA